MPGGGTFRSTSPGGTWSRETGSYTTPGTYATQTPSTCSRTLTHTGTDNRTYPGTDTRTYTGTDDHTFADTFTRTGTNTATSMTPTSTLRRPQTSPRSPLASVRNIVALRKERTPSMSRSPGKSPHRGSATSVSPPPDGEGLFGIRRRAQLQLRDNGQGSEPVTPTRRGDVDAASIRSARSGHLPPGLDVADLLPYTQSDEAPLHIGLLWYLNAHDAPPYRWQRCQALLYPQLLLLSWLSPGGGRGILALDLLNCTSVQSAPSPTHPSARDDIGTIAARSQSVERDGQPLMDMLVPFHMLYADGVERLAAESLLERQKWVNRLCCKSPNGHARLFICHSLTDWLYQNNTLHRQPHEYLEHWFSINRLRAALEICSFDSRLLFQHVFDVLPVGWPSRRTSIVSSHHTRAVDDTVVSNQQYVYPGDPRAIQPARTGSLLRRSGSMTDLDAELQSALTRARGARPGLGFANLVFGGGAPVTISSGLTLGRDIVVTPPPSTGRGSDRARSEVSDEQFFTAGSSEGSRSSYFSQTSYSSELRTSTGLRTDGTSFFDSSAAGTRTLPSMTSYTRTDSASYLGDSQTSMSYTGTSPSRTPLSRTREVRRRGWRSSSRSYSSGYITDASSDKENLSGSYTPESGTQSLDSRSQGSNSYTSGSRSYTSGSRSYTDSGSYTPGGGYSQSGSYTPSGSSTASGVYSMASNEETITPSTLPPQSVPASDLDSENFVAASQGSSDYLTARSPSLRGSIAGSETSFASFPTIPSESECKTADTGYSHYCTASEPSLGSEYITAEICPTIPSEQNTPTLSSAKLDSEEDTGSVLGLPSPPPSEIPSIRSPSMFSEDVLPPLPPSESSPSSIHLTPSPSPPLPPLPPSLPSLSPPPSPLTRAEESLDIAAPTSYRSPSQISLPRSPSSEASSSIPPLSATISSSASDAPPPSLVLPSSPAPLEHLSTPAPRLSSISSPTILSVSSLSDLTPAFSDYPPASPEPWAHETDDSYESSQGHQQFVGDIVPEAERFRGHRLQVPTPSSLSTGVAQRSPLPALSPLLSLPLSGVSSSDVSTPPSIDATTPGTFSLSRSSFPTLSAVSSLTPPILSSADVRTPSDISFSDEQHPQLARSRSTASVASFRSQSSLNSSVFDARSLMDEEDLESVDEPSMVPPLLTTPSQADPELHSPFSMPDGQLRTPEPPSMNVSPSTPRGSAQTIQSSLRTRASESAPTEPLPASIPKSFADLCNSSRPLLTPPDLWGPLEAVREQLSALWEGQVSTHHMLDRLVGDRTPQPQDNTELRDRFLRIEDLLQGLSNQPPREPRIIYEQYPPAPLSSIGSGISLQQLADQLRGFETDQDIPAPVPIREGPSLVERLEGILAAGINQPAPPIQPPPDFINLVFNRRERRSVSPISVQTLPPRPESEPPFPQVYTRPVRMYHLEELLAHHYAPPTPAPATPAPPPQSGAVHPDTGPDFEQALRNIRIERFPGTDGGFTTGRRPAPGPPPAPVFPLGDRRARAAPPEPWYRPAPARQGHSGAPPQAPPPAPINHPRLRERDSVICRCLPDQSYVAQLPPVFDGMLDLLRENRDAQSASVGQQRELMRYMRSLNEWLARDTSDRQDELRGLNARVDQLRQDILNIRVGGESDRSSSTRSDGPLTPSPRGPARPPPFGRPMPMSEPRGQMPQLQHQGPVIPQLPDGQFPPGFIPYSYHLQPSREDPAIPPVIPEMFPGRRPHRSEPPPFTPAIPNLPPSGPGLGAAPPIPMDVYRLPGPMPGMPRRPSSAEPVVPLIPSDLAGRSGSPRIVPPRYPEPRIIAYPGFPSGSSMTSSSRSMLSRSSRSSAPHQIIPQPPSRQGMQHHLQPAHPALALASAAVVVPTQHSGGRSRYEPIEARLICGAHGANHGPARPAHVLQFPQHHTSKEEHCPQRMHMAMSKTRQIPARCTRAPEAPRAPVDPPAQPGQRWSPICTYSRRQSRVNLGKVQVDPELAEGEFRQRCMAGGPRGACLRAGSMQGRGRMRRRGLGQWAWECLWLVPYSAWPGDAG
ncbi:hypothetical protein FPV67DRAFT_1751788 [Lyophyllum atratum]|nr:hypothetical protein FPV67DRAFT_1751788 [Lyophyllum atratum]